MSYNTAAVRQFVLNALIPEEFETLCFDFFRPVHRQFSAGQTQTHRVQLLIDFAERYGMLSEVIEKVRNINEMQYMRFRDELIAEPVPPLRPETDDQAQIELLLVKARDIVAILERQKKRYGSQFVPARFLLELEQRRADVQRLDEQLKNLKQQQTVRRRGARTGTATYDILKRLEEDDGS